MIGERLKSLTTTKVQLEEELGGNINVLKSFFMIELIQGVLSKNDIQERMKKYGYPITWDIYCLITIQIDSLKKTRFNENDYDLIMFAVNNIVEELIPKSDQLSTFLFNHSQITIFGGHKVSEEQFNHSVHSYASKIQDAVLKYLKLKVSIGISNLFSNLQLVPIAYQESLEALNYRLHLGDEMIISASDLKREHHLYSYYPQQKISELFNAIKSEDQDLAFDLIEAILSDIFKQDLIPYDYQILIIRLLVELIELMQTLGIRIPLHTENQSVFHQLLKSKTTEEMTLWYKEKIIQPMIFNLKNRSNSEIKEISEKVIQLIQSDFEAGVTLESCAARLNYSPIHLSAVFKKEMNISFSDYLSLYRHNIAKKWLVESNFSVKEIAIKLEYTNPQNFFRSFRKIEGMTPGKFRELKTSS